MRSVWLVLAIALVAAVAGPASAAAGSKPAPCTWQALNPPLQALAKKVGVKETLGLNQGRDFLCSGAWATSFPVTRGNVVTQLFRSVGGKWVATTRTAKICRKPGDEVPKAIYRLACETN